MSIYRRKLKIPWTARITNEELYRRIGGERKLLKIIKKKKENLILWPYYAKHKVPATILQLIIEGKIEGRRGIGRKKMSWLRNIRHWTGIRMVQGLIHVSRNREEMENVVANIHPLMDRHMKKKKIHEVAIAIGRINSCLHC